MLSCLVAGMVLGIGGGVEAKKEDIVFIMVDDLGWADLGFSGSDFHKTPYIDKLRSEGTFFERFYVLPNCAPTRATIMSGKYPTKHGIYTVASGNRGKAENRKMDAAQNKMVLGKEFETMGEAMRKRGYRTGFVGKWHLGDGEFSAKGRGFDFVAAGNKWGHPKSYFSPYQHPTLQDGPEGEYLTTRMTKEAVGFLEGVKRDEPLFLCLWYYSVHTPVQGRKDLVEKYKGISLGDRHKNVNYAAMVSAVDEGVGEVLAALERVGRGDAVVVFCSDNGGFGGYESVGMKGSGPTDNYPLKGGKGQFYEGGIRSPLVVKWPNKGKNGGTFRGMIDLTDLYPTFLDLAGGVSQKELDGLDGENRALAFQGVEDGASEPYFFHFPGYLAGRGDEWRTTPASGVIDGDWKLVHYWEDDRSVLFNVVEDRGEKRDLVEVEKDRVLKMRGMLDGWLKKEGAKMAKRRVGS